MTRRVLDFVRHCTALRALVLFFAIAFTIPSIAAQIDILGPTGSVAFGTSVAVLPNGNIVVTDPGAASGVGAVYLYDPAGNLISTLTGSSPNDQVGYAGIVVVGNSNFVVNSLLWNNGPVANAGAVTWVNGSTGLTGTVSITNSLVGTNANDSVGNFGVMRLANGNYIVRSAYWSSHLGAVTWGDGNAGVSGAVSPTNSLTGTTGTGITSGDEIGYGATALSNGNYVVASPWWSNGASYYVGAVTWGDGSVGVSGPVSPINSLIGTTGDDRVGYNGVIALNNGAYVVASQYWNSAVGAATWCNTAGCTGAVSNTNSLVGSITGDYVGVSGTTSLSNGNYVVNSGSWNNSAPGSNVGAATWSSGSSGLTGQVSTTNSLYGTAIGDQVGYSIATGLSNGNYVVKSPFWSNSGATSGAGAVTWSDGSGGTTTGAVTTGNSLYGTSVGDHVGSVTALTNGNYVVSSTNWHNGSVNQAGAATWGDGTTGTSGAVSTVNSLFGSSASDQVGASVVALSNGNYVVVSPYWNNGGVTAQTGAATWGDGAAGTVGAVSANNSWVGTNAYDRVGEAGVIALTNGNYVVASYDWANGAATSAGAITWGNGATGLTDTVSTHNSLVGTNANDQLGDGGVAATSDGNYVVISSNWNNGAVSQAGAVTLVSGSFRVKGTIQPWNSVLGAAANSGSGMTYDYDATRHQLVVGRPVENIVSLFTMDQIFAGDFDP
jgi:hypothetical protein